MCQEVPNGDRSLEGEPGGLDARARGEGVGAMVEHLLGEGAGGGLDPQITEHGVGLPATQELDVVGVDASAEEGGGTSRPEGACTQEVRGDARDGFEELG